MDYFGIDLHQKHSEICGMDGEGRVKYQETEQVPGSAWFGKSSGGRTVTQAAMRRLKHSALLGFLPLLVLVSACATIPLLDPRYYELLSQPAPQSLPVPVAGVAKARLWDSYGDPRSGGRRHEGIDIFAKRNTPVLSATEGYVSGLGTNGLGGITVWVMGPGGWRHYYAHLERWGDVRQGQWVEAGTVIGYVGSSGNAATTSPHLHYGIYPPAGGTLNPYPLLSAGPGPALARQPITGPPAEAGDERPPFRGIGARILGELKALLRSET